MGFLSGITQAFSNPVSALETVATGGLSAVPGELQGAGSAVGLGGMNPLEMAGVGAGMMMGGPAGGALAGGMLNMFSAQQQNLMQEQMAANAQNFSASQAIQQENFQTQMSDTAYTRAVADMKNAGINPMLAAGSPESSPSGAMAQGIMPPIVPEAGPAVSGALDAMNTLQNLKESNSRVLKNIQDTSLSESKTYQSDLESSVLDQQASLMQKQNIILGSEASVVGAHPFAAGWLKMLADRGIGFNGATAALSLMGE